MAEVTMPRLSDTMQEGTIGRWLKQPGDHVEKGDILLEIETDKATMEYEAYESGTLTEILVQAGQTVPIGTTIARIGEGAPEPVAQGGDGASPTLSSKEPAPAPPPPAHETNGKPQTAVVGSVAAPASSERVKASPLARRIAAEYGIDLRQVQGTGPGGRIIRQNVEDFYQQRGEAPVETPATGATTRLEEGRGYVPYPGMPSSSPPTPLSRMRHAIATRMTEAKNGIPHLYVTSEIDMGEALVLRRQLNESHAAPVKISINDMVVKAVAKTLREFPVLNSSFVAGANGKPGVAHYERININVAVAVEEGLIVPVVTDADVKSLGTIAVEIQDLAARTREGKIKQSELEGGTLTVSNLGMYDVVEFAAIITPPQSAVLAVSSIRRVPVVRHEQVVIGEVMNVTLSADHRVTDGATVARFLQHFKSLMEAPLKLLV
ncbi:MAG: 2-oxo acid dehydrogenase subunit E2 [Chloroflexaceae bacterium]|nr:2-oxo acid dehydrogenase subunit E2 [Chloroflexaceae bacterium]